MKDLKQKLKTNLNSINTHLQELFKNKNLLKDEKFLDNMAKDIIRLNEDYILLHKEPALQNSTDLLNYLLTTPWGAPFVSDKTLLEAAVAYKFQDPISSDLHELLKGFLKHSTYEDNEFISVFHEIENNLS